LRREDVISLILQWLRERGYEETALFLAAESGTDAKLASSLGKQLLEAVLQVKCLCGFFFALF
jgi:hypothetical protein